MKYRHLLGVLIALNIPVALAEQGSNADYIATYDAIIPVANQDLDNYRGGFKFEKDYIVNIGLTIKTAIDGNVMLHSKIANLVIQNGNLKNLTSSANPTSEEKVSLVNIVQQGSGNHISIDDIASSNIPSTVNASSITNIVQNTIDNSVIGLNTIIDIDAQIGDALKQVRASKQLEEAIMANY